MKYAKFCLFDYFHVKCEHDPCICDFMEKFNNKNLPNEFRLPFYDISLKLFKTLLISVSNNIIVRGLDTENKNWPFVTSHKVITHH